MIKFRSALYCITAPVGGSNASCVVCPPPQKTQEEDTEVEEGEEKHEDHPSK